MTTPRAEAGAALAWALVTLLIVTLACTAIADGLQRQGRVVRRQLEQAALEDLGRAGRALVRASRTDVSAVLAGGTVSVHVVDDRRAEIVAVARITGRERREIVDRPGR